MFSGICLQDQIRIIQAFHIIGKVTGITGDGVNEAPMSKRAVYSHSLHSDNFCRNQQAMGNRRPYMTRARVKVPYAKESSQYNRTGYCHSTCD